jgi:peptide/nickel transport system permease protein
VVGGAVLVENVFNWPGIGKLLVESTVSRDYPVVMGASLVLAVLVVVVNLVIDLLYPLLDPRVSNNG